MTCSNCPEDRGIVLVSGEDWVGVYVGGQLVYQGHSIGPSRLLQLLHLTHTHYANFDMHGAGHLPRTFAEALALKP